MRVWGLRLVDSLLDLPLAVRDAFGGARRRLQWKIQDFGDTLLDVPAVFRSRVERLRHLAPHVARHLAAAAADLPWRVADGGVWVRRRPVRNVMLLAGALAPPVAVTFLVLSSQPVSSATAAAPAAALRAAPDRPPAPATTEATTEQATASAVAKLRPKATVRFRKQASPARGRTKAKKTPRLRKSPPASSTLVSAPPVVSSPVVSSPVVSSPVVSSPVVSAPVSPSATRQAASPSAPPARERESATNVVIVKAAPRPAPFPRVVIEIQPTVTVAPPKPKEIPPPAPPEPLPQP